MLGAAVAAGCVTAPPNPSFRVDRETARDRIAQMAKDPRPLSRPLVILGGWMGPGLANSRLKRRFGSVFLRDQILSVTFLFNQTFDACREKVIAAVEKAFSSQDPVWTREVDVVAVSAGGLVARFAAADRPGKRRLRIRHLFTISTPHRGADWASLFPTHDQLVLDMRAGSDFLKSLDEQLGASRYALVPYVRLGDHIVGVHNAASPGQVAWWVPNAPFQFSHSGAVRDPRIIADIMLRLCDEPPFATEPPAPLPAP